MRRPHDKNRNREVGRDFSPIELRFLIDAEFLHNLAECYHMEPEDAAFRAALDTAAVLRQFPWLNGPSGLFPEA